MRKRSRHTSSRRDSLPVDVLSMLSGWSEQGMENLSALPVSPPALQEKRSGKRVPDLPPAIIFIADLAGGGATSFMEAQKILLQLAQKQNDILMKGLEERVSQAGEVAAIVDLVRRSLNTMLRLQQDFLKTTHKQALQCLDVIRTGDSSSRPDLVPMARDAVERFVRAQSEFLKVIAEGVLKASNPRRPQKSLPVRPVELSKLAKTATRAFIEAQEKLLGVMGRQLDKNLKQVSRSIQMGSAVQYVPIASAAGEAIANFVSAEKALIDATVGSPTASKCPVMSGNRARLSDSRKAGAGG